MRNLLPEPKLFHDAAQSLIETCAELAQRGWTPATSSNFSVRVDDNHIAITVSGKDKGRLTQNDIMLIDRQGKAINPEQRPSAETLLHTQIYDRYAEIRCVLHTHSMNQTLTSMLHEAQGCVSLKGYELLKAFSGNHTHALQIDVPVFPNSQDMNELSMQVAPLLKDQGIWGYLIAGHGLYAWGKDIFEARRHLEAFEFLFECELRLRSLRA